jgi:hypothetical protein
MGTTAEMLITMDGEEEVLAIFGGREASDGYATDSALYVYAVANDTWASLDATMGLGARQDHSSMVYNGSSMLLFGGYDGSTSKYLSDLWRVNVTDTTHGHAERVVITTSEPEGRYGASLTAIAMTNSTALSDSSGDGAGSYVRQNATITALLFGGHTTGRGVSDDWYLLQVEETMDGRSLEGRWQQLSTDSDSGPAPAARAYHASAPWGLHSPCVMVFGGYNHLLSTTYGDLWKVCATNTSR